MLNEKVAALLNTQVNKEFYSAYLYLHFANFYTEQGLSGFANWYQVQAQEERDHAMLMVQYLQNNDAKVTFEAIAKPDAASYAEYIEEILSDNSLRRTVGENARRTLYRNFSDAIRELDELYRKLIAN